MNQPAPEYERSYAAEPVKTSSEAIISLIAGILAWLGLFGLGGIIAVIFGHIAKNQIRKSGGTLGGDGLATAGLIIGYANIAITVIGLCLVMMLILGLISAGIFILPFANSWNWTY
jgi:hypothetical protein